jgi:hypothetical protein
VCRGEIYQLEIQAQEDGTVVGSVWTEIPATFWEPAEMDCIIELEYKSVDAARDALERVDREAAEEEARWDEHQDKLDREYAEYLESLKN